MPEIKQAGFAGGEIAPEMYGRTDLDRYYNSLKRCVNFEVNSRGAAVRRQGFEYVNGIRDVGVLFNDRSDFPRLVPFIFNEEQAYVLEIGSDSSGVGAYIRFHRDGATILEPGGAHDGGNGQAVLTDSDKMWVVNGFVGKVITNVTKNETATITANTANTITGVLSGAAVWDDDDVYTIADAPLEIPHPYSFLDIHRLKFAQRNDVLTIVHQDYAPRQLKRFGDDAWALTTLTVTRPVNPPTAASISGFNTPDAASGHPAVTWSWVVTAVDEAGNESLISNVLTEANATLYPDYPRPTLSITAPAAGNTPVKYNVYRGRNGYWGFVGSTDTTSFIDEGYVPNYFDAPPTAYDPFAYTVTEGEAAQPGGARELLAVAGVATKVLAAEAFDDNYTWHVDVFCANNFPDDSETVEFDIQYDKGAGWQTLDSITLQAPPIRDLDEVIEFTYNVDGMGADPTSQFRINVTGGTGGTAALDKVTYTEAATMAGSPGTVGNYPSAVTFYQQRLFFGGFTYNRQQLTPSRTGDYANFDRTAPSRDDDSFDLTVDDDRLNEIRDLVAHRSLLIFTSGAEYLAEGGGGGPMSLAGAMTPTSFSISPQTYYGSSWVSPLKIGGAVLFLAQRDRTVREWRITQGDPVPRDLSVVAAHLFDVGDLYEWAYADVPNQIVWAVRSDGTLLGMTYVPEHNVWGWHRHETQGEFKSVAVIPEGDEHRVYVVVRRIINGSPQTYIERLSTSRWTSVDRAIFADSALTWDGEGTSATSNWAYLITASGASYNADDLVTLTAANNSFTSGNIGDYVVLEGWNDPDDPTLVTDTAVCRITAYTSPTVVTARVVTDVPTALQAVRADNVKRGVSTFAGLDHLEGESVVAILGGKVQAAKVVSGGSVTFDDWGTYAVIGLAYTSQLETLNLTSRRNQDRLDKKGTPQFGAEVEHWRGLEGGASFDDLREITAANVNDGYGTGKGDNNLIYFRAPQGMDRSRRIALQQAAPLPAKILSVLVELE